MLDAHKTVGRESASLPKLSQGKRNFRKQLIDPYFPPQKMGGKDLREKVSLCLML